MILFNDIKAFFSGKRQYTFYFLTLTFGDSLLAILLSLMQVFGLRAGEKPKDRFLADIKNDYRFKDAYLFGSARSSLYALLKSLEYEKGSEVLLTGYTCEVVPNAVINAGFVPIYIDIDPSSYCIDPLLIEKSITPKSRVIVIQHTFGIPALIEEIVIIARKHNLFIIEDCAVSLGSKYKGSLTGTFGDAAIFSFELSKTITSCWGGMLLLNSDQDNVINLMDRFYCNVPEQKYKQRIMTLFQLGMSGILYSPKIYILSKYVIALLFKLRIFSPSTTTYEYNGCLPPDYLVKLTSEQTIVLRRQYSRTEVLFQKRHELKMQYIDKYSEHLHSKFKQLVSEKDVVLIRFPLLIENRQAIGVWFDKNYIEMGSWFTSPLSSELVDKEVFNYKPGSCRNSELVSRKIVNLPLIPYCSRVIMSNNTLFEY